jgi:NNP family nitrate/nitrite transporter-like MFS transporter
MPLAVSLLASLGIEAALGWRLAMLAPGLALLGMAVAYARLAQDVPEGSYQPPSRASGAASAGLRAAAREPRAWGLMSAYAACFGVELTLANVAALYFHDRFGLGLAAAGAIAAGYGGMNLFTRALGGFLSDRVGARRGIAGRTALLGLLLLGEGVALAGLSRAGALASALPALLAVALCVQMANGATYGIVPLVNRRALGSVTGLVGAGGNAGGVAAGFVLRASGSTADGLLALAVVVVAIAGLASVLALWGEGREAAGEAAVAKGIAA